LAAIEVGDEYVVISGHPRSREPNAWIPWKPSAGARPKRCA